MTKAWTPMLTPFIRMNRWVSILIFSVGVPCFFYTTGLQAAEPALRDKISQMLLIGFDGFRVSKDAWIVKAMDRYPLGGVILFDYNQKTKTYRRNIASPAQTRALNHQLQQWTSFYNHKHHRADVPLIISIDYEGGLVNRLKDTQGFPKTLSQAQVGRLSDLEITHHARAMARTLRDLQFNVNFSPVLDVNVYQDNPIIGHVQRSFSPNAEKVAHDGKIYTENYLAEGIQCAYKHFPGHGSSHADSHLGFVDVTTTWSSKELIPYQRLLSLPHPCGMIMSAHLVNRQLDPSGLPATLSHRVLTDLLRQHLHFKGVVVTDDLQMKAISTQYDLKQVLTLAINAGADLLVFGNQLVDRPQEPGELIDLIEHQVKTGHITRQRIDEAYHRIVHFKTQLAYF